MVTVAAAVGSATVLGGAGGIVLLAPLGWVLYGTYRRQLLAKRLAYHRAQPTS